MTFLSPTCSADPTNTSHGEITLPNSKIEFKSYYPHVYSISPNALCYNVMGIHNR